MVLSLVGQDRPMPSVYERRTSCSGG
jgi:hypothetical protein